jgi:hypothetical protein
MGKKSNFGKIKVIGSAEEQPRKRLFKKVKVG